MADTKKLYNDIVYERVDIEDIVLQDHAHVENILPNITFKLSEDGGIIASVPFHNEVEFALFIQEQEKKGYLVMGF